MFQGNRNNTKVNNPSFRWHVYGFGYCLLFTILDFRLGITPVLKRSVDSGIRIRVVTTQAFTFMVLGLGDSFFDLFFVIVCLSLCAVGCGLFIYDYSDRASK